MEQRFRQTQDGRIFAVPPSIANRDHWSKYLPDPDSSVLVFARISPALDVPCGIQFSDGERVQFCALPDYAGPVGYLRQSLELHRSAREAIAQCDAFICRGPGRIGALAWREIRRKRLAYGVEVVGDPWEAFAPGSVRSAIRPAVRRIETSTLREMCDGAAAVNYVTQQTLQVRYPAGNSAVTTSSSDVLLPEDSCTSFVLDRRLRRIADSENTVSSSRRLTIGTAGTFAQPYKGQPVLIRALARCIQAGLDARLEFAGEGIYRADAERLARDLGVGQSVQFHGAVAPEEVVRLMDSWDLFVLPSFTEGLPRALIEAMSRGCPCVATAIGGVPELLSREDTVEPRDAGGLASRILEVARTSGRMARMAERNMQRVTTFRPAAQRLAWANFMDAVSRTSFANRKMRESIGAPCA